MNRHRRRKSRRGFTPLILGVWCTLFAGYSHLACKDSTTGGNPAPDAGLETGAPGDSSVADAPDDAPDDAPINDDAPTGDVGTFDDAAGNYAADDTGCGLPAFALTATNEIVANPFGENGAVKFALKSGSQNVCEATGLIIFAQPDHTCTITNTRSGALDVACTNPQGGSCAQAFSKQ